METRPDERIDRRGFLGMSLLAAAGAGIFRSAFFLAPPGTNPCVRAAPSATLAGEDEPGERLHVSGTVYRPDGVTPAAGVTVYAYQTDAQGYYSRRRNAPPRLRGWMRTGADGRYGFQTIKPAPYPGRTNAAHIHTQLWGSGVPPQYGPTILFEGDSLITGAERREAAALGSFGFIRPLTRDGGGVWRAVQDIRAKGLGDRFEDNTMHGLAACGVEP